MLQNSIDVVSVIKYLKIWKHEIAMKKPVMNQSSVHFQVVNMINLNLYLIKLTACVNNIQNDYDRFKERNGTSDTYDDRQLKL